MNKRIFAVDEKLHWTFRLYDVDGNGEIDIFEMEKMFVSLCSIVEGSENDQLKRNRKEQEKSVLAEKIRQEKEELLMMLEREREMENMKYKFKNGMKVQHTKFQSVSESTRTSLAHFSESPQKDVGIMALRWQNYKAHFYTQGNHCLLNCLINIHSIDSQIASSRNFGNEI